MKTKKKVLIITLLFINYLFLNVNLTQAISIIDVQVIPPSPSIQDTISIYSYGGLSHIDSSFDYSDLTLNDNLITLDIHYISGYLDVSGPWYHTEPIGLLPEGTYDLNVNFYEGHINDSYFTEFRVVPEPMSIALLSFGVIAIRFRYNQKK